MRITHSSCWFWIRHKYILNENCNTYIERDLCGKAITVFQNKILFLAFYSKIPHSLNSFVWRLRKPPLPFPSTRVKSPVCILNFLGEWAGVPPVLQLMQPTVDTLLLTQSVKAGDSSVIASHLKTQRCEVVKWPLRRVNTCPGKWKPFSVHLLPCAVRTLQPNETTLCLTVIWVQTVICPHAGATRFTFLSILQTPRNRPHPCSMYFQPSFPNLYLLF